jgi:hypothetical protein
VVKIQAAGYPEFVDWILQVFDTPGAVRDSWRTDLPGALQVYLKNSAF